jgi:hypothetical protein
MTYALLIGVFAFATESGNASTVRAVCVGMLLAALASLKNTALPVALMIVALVIVHRHWRRWRDAAREGLATLCAAAVPLVLWYAPHIGRQVSMIPLRHGSGLDEASVQYMWFWVSTNPPPLYSYGYAGAIALMGVIGVLLLLRSELLAEACVVFASTVVGCLAVTWLTGGVSITRYNRPLVVFGCIAIAASIGSRMPHRVWRDVVATIALLASLAMCRNSVLPITYREDFARALAALRMPIPDDPSPAEIASSTRKAQDALPAGARALIRVDRPYLLDFSRNRLCVIDFPNAVSPKPGLDRCHDTGCVDAYLRGQQIDYVMYAYGTEANFSVALVRDRLANPYFTPWQRALNRRVPPFNALFAKLVAEHRALYDDGTIAVVDVGARR